MLVKALLPFVTKMSKKRDKRWNKLYPSTIVTLNTLVCIAFLYSVWLVLTPDKFKK